MTEADHHNKTNQETDIEKKKTIRMLGFVEKASYDKINLTSLLNILSVLIKEGPENIDNSVEVVFNSTKSLSEKNEKISYLEISRSISLILIKNYPEGIKKIKEHFIKKEIRVWSNYHDDHLFDDPLNFHEEILPSFLKGLIHGILIGFLNNDPRYQDVTHDILSIPSIKELFSLFEIIFSTYKQKIHLFNDTKWKHEVEEKIKNMFLSEFFYKECVFQLFDVLTEDQTKKHHEYVKFCGIFLDKYFHSLSIDQKKVMVKAYRTYKDQENKQ